MSLASMKLKKQLSTSDTSLGEVQLEVVAVHHHRDARELNVHLRPVGAPESGTVDLVLLGDDRDAALLSTPQVGQRFRLALEPVRPEPEPVPVEPEPEQP